LKIKKSLSEEDISIDEETKDKVDLILEKLEEISKDFNPRELELAASIHFILNYTSGLEKKGVDEIIKVLQGIKGYKFNKHEIRNMYNLMKKNNLLRGS